MAVFDIEGYTCIFFHLLPPQIALNVLDIGVINYNFEVKLWARPPNSTTFNFKATILRSKGPLVGISTYFLKCNNNLTCVQLRVATNYLVALAVDGLCYSWTFPVLASVSSPSVVVAPQRTLYCVFFVAFVSVFDAKQIFAW